jgi:hypothetical protein
MKPVSRQAVSARRSVVPLRPFLASGVAIPVIYFGIQLAAAPFYPGYSFFSRDASSLGSSASAAPWIFNVGVLLLAVIKLGVAGAFLVALPRAGVGRGVTVLTALALTSAGLGSLNAFLHPLPSQRHVEGVLAALGRGVALLPVLSAVVLWRLGSPRQAVATVIGCLVLIPVMTGLTQRVCIGAGLECAGYQWFLNNYHGLIQRLGAAVVFVPVGVVSYILWRQSLNPLPPAPARYTATPVARW